MIFCLLRIPVDQSYHITVSPGLHEPVVGATCIILAIPFTCVTSSIPTSNNPRERHR